MEIFFIIIAVIGVLLATIGIIGRSELKSDYFHLVAGLCLVTYSIYIKDIVFIILQIIFMSGALYEIVKIRKEKKTKRGSKQA